MIKTDPLDFLDEHIETESTIEPFEHVKGKSDALSFLEEPTQKEQPSPNKKAKKYSFDGEPSDDPLSFLTEEEPQPEESRSFSDLFKPKPMEEESLFDIYRPEEKTSEQLKSMSVQEKMEYAQDLNRFREFQQSRGFGKGALSGLTFGASEHIPALKPNEEDLMVGLGEMTGSFLPISKLYNFVGKPLVNLAMKSPIAKQGLMSLARMTGMGLSGAAYEGAKETIKTGEIPSVEELAKTGATWAAIDGVLQGLGLGVAFSRAVKNIAETEGITAKDVLSKLWDSTKNYVKLKFGRAVKGEIVPEDVEVLMEQAKLAEKKGLSKPKEIEFRPEEAAAEKELVVPELKEPITEVAEETTIQPTFTTSKGSTYQVHEDGSTTRVKAARAEHPNEEGIQPTSEKTWYITPEDSLKLGEFQTHGESKRVVELPNGQLGVQYLTGNNEGKIENRTLVDFSKEPKEGMIPVESWEDGEKIHFGNQIDKVEGITPEVKTDELTSLKNQLADLDRTQGKGATKEKSALIQKINELELEKHNRAKEVKAEEFEYTREDFPNKKEAQKYLDHLQNSLEKAPEVHKPRLRKDIKNLEELVSGFEAKPVEELPKKQTQVPPKSTSPRQPVKGKKQAVARSKIIKLFRNAFNDPIRLGKISQRNTAGIHKLWPKVTRLLKDNDIETVAHEIGHNLHTTLYGGNAATPKEQYKNINNALHPYLDELKPLAHYEPWGMEGFAEFTRLYVTNPEVAKELAPKFYDKFEADLEAQYPEMKNALLEAREYYDQYLQGTPQSRIRAQTSYGEDKGKLANIIDSLKKNLNLDNLKTQFLDDVFPAKRLVAEAFGIPTTEVENLKDERNLYRALRVLKGAVGKGDVFVLHETFNAKTLDKINGSLKDILKKLPDEESYREFNDYLIARRSIEKSTQNIETGINAGDALIVEADLRPKYGKLAEELDKYNNSLLAYAHDSGLISDKQLKMIKDNNVLYTPFQRVMEVEKGGAASGGRRLQAGKPIKRMKGSTRDIIAPIESILKNTYNIIINAEKNLAGQVLGKIAKMKNMGAYVEAVPTPIKLKGKIEGEQVAKELAKRFEKEGLEDLLEYDEKGKPVLREDIADAIPEVFLRFGTGQYPAGENIVTVYENGKPKYYQVTPEIFEMWNKGIAPYSAGLLTKILRIPARTLRAGAILNPKFMMKNIVRDTWGSWLFTKYGKSVKDPVSLFIDTLYSPLAMLSTSAGKGKLYVEWMKSGGAMGTMQSLDRDTVVKKLDEVRRGWKSYSVIKWLRQVAEVSEEANRLSEFGKALEVEGKTRLGREIAAFAARDLSIDFAKIGLQTKVLNQIIPFFNATVQGGDKLLRTLANPEDRKDFLPRILGFIVLPSLMLAWLNKDDENIKEFQAQEQDFNFITKVGGQYIKIPVPFETGVIAHGLTQRMFNYFVKKDPEAFEKFMGSVSDAMLPSFIPTMGLPFIEAWGNKSFFTGSRIIPRAQEDLISKYQYKNNTSSTARLIGRSLAYMLGQETRSKMASPAIIDHFINAWGGGLGRLMINISDASLEASGLSDKIPNPNQTIIEKLGLDAFITRFPRASTSSIEKFYDNYADAIARQKSFKYAEKMDLESDEALEKGYKRFEKVYDYDTFKKAYKAIQSCQKEINNIWNDPTIDSALKKQFIDDLYLQMIDFAKAANEDIRQYRLAQ